ncbi:MAG: elongation factor G [Oscillospiraceae bacterium]|jgi:elongation factor G|nr:elongation factor G [Oscillospiraceae bacterium]
MQQYTAKKIRNLVIAGHGGTGKTSLAESMLYLAKATDRLGKVLEGNTVCDFDPEEIRRKATVSTAIAPLEWKGCKVNLIDVPGLFDFAGGVAEGFRAAECALIAVSGKSGVNVGTEKAYKAATAAGISKIFFINKLDDENADYYKAFEDLKSVFGPSVCPIVVPFREENKPTVYIDLLHCKAYTYSGGKAAEVSMPDMGHRLDGLRTAIYEAVAETSEELMEKYFSGEQFTPEELIVGLATGVRSGDISPVFGGSALTLEGIDQLLAGIEWLVPSPADGSAVKAKDVNGNEIELPCNEDAQTAAVVFKTVADPFVGKLSYFKVISGKLSAETPLTNMRTGSAEKIGKIVTIRGKKQEDAAYISAGDIGAVAKLQHANTGDTLCSPARQVILEGVNFPAPSLSMCIAPKTKGEEEKIALGLARLIEEDPSISYYNNTETHQMILQGQGDQHLDVVVSKLKSKFGVDVVLSIPKVPYRETIRKTVSVQGRHKKQSGGHGQFGDTWIRFEPCDSDDLVFTEEVVGGSVPKGFFPAVEKGLRDCIGKGILAGYPVVGLKAVLYDGSYHPVDSSEMAFKLAAAVAYKAGIPQASPVILEPIGALKAYIPDDKMGDLMGEVNKRRGRVLGMNPAEEGLQELDAEVPMAEMGDFSTFMRQTTQGRGYFAFDFERYEEAPTNIAQKVIEEAKASGDVE